MPCGEAGDALLTFASISRTTENLVEALSPEASFAVIK
jgi:hypothetical protein